MSDNKPWDKYLLLLIGVAAIAVAGIFIAKSASFSDQFSMSSPTPKNELPPTEATQAVMAKSFVDTVNEWKLSIKGRAPKPVPLFVSIPIVEIEGRLIDMLDPQAEKIRPPVTNAWLMSNNLDYLNKGVLSQDPDGDGFSNLEEWNGKTEPRSADSHPPYVNKLSMVSRQQAEYILKFAARPDSETFQIIRLPSVKWPKRDNFNMKVGEISEDKQFRIDSFEEKTAKNSIGINVDASVLHITYLPKQKKVALIRNIPEKIPTYYVELDFSLDPFQGNDRFVKEGETFTIARDPDTKYRVIKVEENSATITYQPASGQEKTVEIEKK